MELVQITNENVERYESVLLPQVYQMMLGDGMFAPEMLLCIGKEDGGVAAGAIVAELSDDGDIQILSLIVAPEYRRRGIGKELFEAMIDVASSGYVLVEDPQENVCEIAVEYDALSSNAGATEAFLSAIGFDSFEAYPEEASISSEQLREIKILSPAFQKEFKPVMQVKCVADLAKEESEKLYATLNVAIDPMISYIKGSVSKPEAGVFARIVNERAVLLEVAETVANGSKIAFLSAVQSMLHKLTELLGTFQLTYEPGEECADFTELIKSATVERSQTKRASARILFSET